MMKSSYILIFTLAILMSCSNFKQKITNNKKDFTLIDLPIKSSFVISKAIIKDSLLVIGGTSKFANGSPQLFKYNLDNHSFKATLFENYLGGVTSLEVQTDSVNCWFNLSPFEKKQKGSFFVSNVFDDVNMISKNNSQEIIYDILFEKDKKIKICKSEDATVVFESEFENESWRKVDVFSSFRSLEEKRFILKSNLLFGIGNKISFNDKDREIFAFNITNAKINSVSLNNFDGELMELASINEVPILLFKNNNKVDVYSIVDISNPKLIRSFVPPVDKNIVKLIITDKGLIILITVKEIGATNLYEIIETDDAGKKWNIDYSTIKYDFVSFDGKKLCGINENNDLIILDYSK